MTLGPPEPLLITTSKVLPSVDLILTFSSIFFSNKAPACHKKGAHHPPPKPDSDLVLMQKEREACVNATKLKMSAEGQGNFYLCVHLYTNTFWGS